MTDRRVLIDASNLVVGGGVQVGASVVDEVLLLRSDSSRAEEWPWLQDADIHVSPQVRANLTHRGADAHVHVTPLRGRLPNLRRRPGSYDVSFAVFGPVYDGPRARRRISGFADGTSLFPELSARRRSLFGRIRQWVSRRYFSSCNLVISESEFVESSLTERWNIPPSRQSVIPNSLNRVFHEPSKQEAAPAIHSTSPVFAFPARAYPHKNIAILGPTAEVLRRKHGREIKFAVTLTPEEWLGLASEVRDHLINVGPLKVSQVPGFLSAAAGTVFPSLLESFSITPLEALAAGSPLAASDRQFVSEAVGECAEYFDPTDPESIAAALLRVLDDSSTERVKRGLRLAEGWPTPDRRVSSFLSAINDQLLELA